MASNLDRYKHDLKKLVALGQQLELAMQVEFMPEGFERKLKKDEAAKLKSKLADLPSVRDSYQLWYSEAKALIRQLLPDRLEDFVRHYEKPKQRKAITYENYRIEDYLQRLTVTRGFSQEKIVGPEAALTHLQQQVGILRATEARFESSLFDIRQLVQADLLDSELEAAGELIRAKYLRAAGAVAGVVLERHLAQVCQDHSLVLSKNAPGIADLSSALKSANVIDTVQWRFVQHLADIRNLCDHARTAEPRVEQVQDLVAGVKKVTRTVF